MSIEALNSWLPGGFLQCDDLQSAGDMDSVALQHLQGEAPSLSDIWCLAPAMRAHTEMRSKARSPPSCACTMRFSRCKALHSLKPALHTRLEHTHCEAEGHRHPLVHLTLLSLPKGWDAVLQANGRRVTHPRLK